jgi:hypothetical protein
MEKSYSLETLKEEFSKRGIPVSMPKKRSEKNKEELLQELRMLDKLIELNLKDLWDIADQRDWYYYELERLKGSARS